MSLEQFLALPECEPDGTHYELSDGELITLPPPGYRHGVILVKIAAILITKLDPKEYIVAGGDAGFVLNPRPDAATVRGADVAVNRRKDIGATPPAGWFHGSPFVAVEIVSPSNSAEDMERKSAQYLAAGSQEVWLVYPSSERVYIYSAGQRAPHIVVNGESFDSVLGCSFNTTDFFEI